MEYKYITFVDGPLATYRFDIFLDGSPKLKEKLIVLCTEFSYNLYSDYHQDFEFVILDDIRKHYPQSIKNEILPKFKTEEEWLSNINNFYNRTKNNFFPYELHRFIFPYLIENNILNFCIVDNDLLYTPSIEIHNLVFENIKPGTLYTPFYGVNPALPNRIQFFIDNLSKDFPDFDFNNSGDFIDADGFARGFHFKSKDHMLLFFEIWNKGIEYLLNGENGNIVGNGNGIYQIEWFISYLMQYFVTNLNYEHLQFHDLFFVQGQNAVVHKTRVEDTLYVGPRPQWNHYNFDYSDTSTISNFIKNNKNQLEIYWSHHVPYRRITDTHVYTRI